VAIEESEAERLNAAAIDVSTCVFAFAFARHENGGDSETSGLTWKEFECRASARARERNLLAWHHKVHLDPNGEGFLFFRDRIRPPEPTRM
jgi:hypothetical protein